MAISGIGYWKQCEAEQSQKAGKKMTAEVCGEAISASIEARVEKMRQEEVLSENGTVGKTGKENSGQMSGRVEVVKGSRLKAHLCGEEEKVPYGYLAKDGIIEYNGVTFVCDSERNQLHLGDTTIREDCITIPLENGGSLVVNRDNLDALAKAIGMFSPEDANRIMRAMHQDAKVKQMEEEIKEEENNVGRAVKEETEK